jgi:hypothetical protein
LALKGLAAQDKLAEVITSLKHASLLNGSQVGIAQSFLNFRNNALRAKWNLVDRSRVESVLAFVDQLLLAHFA